MRILATGGRDYADKDNVWQALDYYAPELLIVGGARGADALAEAWAKSRQVAHLVMPAQWDKHGKAAGMIRNRDMLEQGKPDLVLAFPGGRGTDGMKRIARDAGIEVVDGC